jgi:co-chaperonin GroES (HSP10)
VSFRAFADNVVLALEPLETETKSGLALVPDSKGKAYQHRTARVLYSGPGMRFERTGVLRPSEVKAGDRVIVDALCGDPTSLHRTQEFKELFGDRGEFRIVREDEIHAVVEE